MLLLCKFGYGSEIVIAIAIAIVIPPDHDIEMPPSFPTAYFFRHTRDTLSPRGAAFVVSHVA